MLDDLGDAAVACADGRQTSRCSFLENNHSRLAIAVLCGDRRRNQHMRSAHLGVHGFG
jgi:hypothetical protein